MKNPKLYSIYSKRSGALVAALTKDSVVAIYPDSNAFIFVEDKGVIFPHEVTAEGGLQRITIVSEKSRELRQLRKLREANGFPAIQ